MSRFAVVDPLKCQPSKCKQQCRTLCPVNAGGKQCVEIVDVVGDDGKTKKRSRINESMCVGCGICTKKCPFGAIRILNIPTLAMRTMMHRFNQNGFQLSGLPCPTKGDVLGVVGRNGCGKSTVLRILSGKLTPNFADLKVAPSWARVMEYFKGSKMRGFLDEMLSPDFVCAVKPQFIDSIPRVTRGTCRDLLSRNEASEETIDEFSLRHLLERNIEVLSGGELQRLAIACVLSKSANLYCIDEPTAFLDVSQRITSANAIRKIREKGFVLTVEHDLATLDYLSDSVCMLYGEPSAYGIVSTTFTSAHGINVYLEGVDPVANIRFRDEPLHFRIAGEIMEEPEKSRVTYPTVTKKLGDFELNIEGGTVESASVTVLLAQNGCGKTTFLRILAGLMTAESEKGEFKSELITSYKPQKIDPTSDLTVRLLLASKISSALTDSYFKSAVIDALDIEPLFDLAVKTLSGGELQRIAIALALGKPAALYLIDEPSAYLDVDQRITVSRVLKRFSMHRNVAIFVVEHDLMMAVHLADRFIVFEGEPGVKCTASTLSSEKGLVHFLKGIDVTIRRDKRTGRMRINKKDSALDREQKATGVYVALE